jgi:hypothetical protein
LIRLFPVLLLAASLRGCVTYEFEHEFWINTDGSGSFVVTAPPWIWNTVKNVGESQNLEASVTTQSVGALFQNPSISSLRVRKVTRQGRAYITVAGNFSNLNALVGTPGFPDLVVALRRDGDRLRLFGVWRRPGRSGNAQGDDRGLMAVRFHLPSEIFEHRNASLGVERGNILSWRQDLREGLAGAPIDFGATLGTTSVLRATLGLFALAVLAAAAIVGAVLLLFARRGKGGGGSKGRNPPGPSRGEADFLSYDPTSSAR